MSTFLELCADLTRESGAIGTAPAAVTAQTGRQLKCVEWIAAAWETIQNGRRDWTFLRSEFSKSLTIDQTAYIGGAGGWALTRFGEFLGDRPTFLPTTIYLPADGQETETELRQIDFDTWRTRYDRSTHDAGRPHEYAIAPDRTIRFGSKPDAAYTVRGEYRKTGQVLAANGDIPDMPDRFHMIIVWRAIMMMADADEAVQALALARAKYAELYRAMVRDCTPGMSLEGTMA